MSEPKPIPPRVRLQMLLAVPDRERSESQWDELNELEITLASAVRETPPEQGVRRNVTASPGRPQSRGRPQGENSRRKVQKRPPKRAAP
jgi:hypothetical protein